MFRKFPIQSADFRLDLRDFLLENTNLVRIMGKIWMFVISISLATVVLLNAAGRRPIQIVIVFDRSESFWRWTVVAHAVVVKLFQELRFVLPSSGDDMITFVELSHQPRIVTQLKGAAVWTKGSEAFLRDFDRPVPEKGTALVEALWLVAEAFEADPNACKILLFFSDFRPDPCPPKVASWVENLKRFDWNRLEGVDGIWIFLWESKPTFDERGRPYAMILRESFPPLRQATFVKPPPLVNDTLERRHLNAFVDRLVAEISAHIAGQLTNSDAVIIPPQAVALTCLLGAIFLVIAAALSRRRSGR